MGDSRLRAELSTVLHSVVFCFTSTGSATLGASHTFFSSSKSTENLPLG